MTSSEGASAGAAKASPGQEKSNIPSTLAGVCLQAIVRHDKPDGVSEKRDGEWVHISAAEFVRRVRHIALGLADVGIRPKDRVALISENRPEWSIADLAILSLGAVTVPIYTTQSIDQIQFILEDSGTRALLISGGRVLKYALKGFEDARHLDYVIVFDPKAAAGLDRAITLESIETRGAAMELDDASAFNKLLARGRSEDLATIIYTSGTTGEPKGVMLTHNNFVSNVLSITGGLPIMPTDVSLSVLPLSHIFERTVFYVFCYMGVSVNYAASIEQVGEHLREVGPTIMTAGPRLFEKLSNRMIKERMWGGSV